MAPALMGGPSEPDDVDKADLMQGHAGPGVALQKPPSLGDMVSRPSKGVPYEPPTPPMMEVPGKDKNDWIAWDGEMTQIHHLQ